MPRRGPQLKLEMPEKSAESIQKACHSFQEAEEPHVELLNGKILVTGSKKAQNEGFIIQKGVTHVVNCISHQVQNLFGDKLKYQSLAMDDSVDFEVTEKLVMDATDFIGEAVNCEKGTVLVHCRMGRSRSVAIAIAYMMRFHSVSFDTCIEEMLKQNTHVCPNLVFVEVLKKLEAKLTEEQQMNKMPTFYGKKTQSLIPTIETQPTLTFSASQDSQDTCANGSFPVTESSNEFDEMSENDEDYEMEVDLLVNCQNKGPIFKVERVERS